MVRCVYCGVHLPRSESLTSDGKFFCSDEHRRLHLESLGRFMAATKGLYIVDSDQKAMVPWMALESGPTAEGPTGSGPKPLAEGRAP